MIRLYHFDLARNTIDVETISPWILGQEPEQRNELEQREIELTDPTNRFSLADRLRRAVRRLRTRCRRGRPAAPAAVLVQGTRRLLAVRPGTRPTARRCRTASGSTDLSGRGNHLDPGHPRRQRAGRRCAGRPSTTATSRRTPASSSTAARSRPAAPTCVRSTARRSTTRRSRNGYTIEAFVKLPADVRATNHAWMSIVSRFGAGATPARPAATRPSRSPR